MVSFNVWPNDDTLCGIRTHDLHLIRMAHYRCAKRVNIVNFLGLLRCSSTELNEPKFTTGFDPATTGLKCIQNCCKEV